MVKKIICRFFLRFFVLLTACLGLGSCVSSSKIDNQTKNKPNIVIFITDDLTYTDLGPYASQNALTPNLDAFAQQALKFNYAFDTASMCAPTRMALYTGIQPVRNGAHPNHSKVYDDVRSMPNYLRPLGYRVGIIGKRHEAPLRNFSFEYLGGKSLDVEKSDPAKKTREIDMSVAEEFIKSTDRPFALVVSSNQPHEPWDLGDRSQYKPEEIKVPEDLIDTPETRLALQAYYAEITFADFQFGEILRFLKEADKESNTLVFFLSEQGSTFPFAKWTLYDAGVHAGILARWPGVIKEGSETDAIVQYVDLLPTFLDILEVEENKFDFDGRSILSVLKGETDRHRDFACGIQTTQGILSGSESYPVRSIRNYDYRLIWNLDYNQRFSNVVTVDRSVMNTFSSWQKGNEKAQARANAYITRPEFELYDMRNTHIERENLADSPAHQQIKREMLAQLKSWMQQQGDSGVQTEAEALSRKRSRDERFYPLGVPEGGLALDVEY